MGWHHDWMGGIGGFMFPGFGLIITIIVVMAIIWFVSKGLGGGSPHDITKQSETPLDILKRRYASGEIDKETYEQMKRELQD